jgi:hypothetical protein
MTARTPNGSESDSGRDRLTSWLKRIGVAISVVAALLSIVAYLIGWFGPAAAAQPSAVAEYDQVCTLANTEQAKWEHQLARFRTRFEGAHNPTEARDALLSLAELDVADASALWSALDALTPASAMAATQGRLLKAWSRSLSLLRAYRDHLSTAGSVTELVTLTPSIPRSQIEGNETLASALLMRLGGLGCQLSGPAVEPVTQWSPAFAGGSAKGGEANGGGEAKGGDQPTADAAGAAGAIPSTVIVPAIAAPAPTQTTAGSSKALSPLGQPPPVVKAGSQSPSALKAESQPSQALKAESKSESGSDAP